MSASILKSLYSLVFLLFLFAFAHAAPTNSSLSGVYDQLRSSFNLEHKSTGMKLKGPQAL